MYHHYTRRTARPAKFVPKNTIRRTPKIKSAKIIQTNQHDLLSQLIHIHAVLLMRSSMHA